jgi:glycosyltransferase involved in cell wall biosynthesis
MVCFEKAGGAQDLIETDAGMIVPYLSLEAMANAVRIMKENPEIRTKMGRIARRKFFKDIRQKKLFKNF